MRKKSKQIIQHTSTLFICARSLRPTRKIRGKKGYLREAWPRAEPAAELGGALEALELDLLLSGGEFAFWFTCSCCNLERLEIKQQRAVWDGESKRNTSNSITLATPAALHSTFPTQQKTQSLIEFLARHFTQVGSIITSWDAKLLLQRNSFHSIAYAVAKHLQKTGPD